MGFTRTKRPSITVFPSTMRSESTLYFQSVFVNTLPFSSQPRHSAISMIWRFPSSSFLRNTASGNASVTNEIRVGYGVECFCIHSVASLG